MVVDVVDMDVDVSVDVDVDVYTDAVCNCDDDVGAMVVDVIGVDADVDTCGVLVDSVCIAGCIVFVSFLTVTSTSSARISLGENGIVYNFVDVTVEFEVVVDVFVFVSMFVFVIG